MVVNEKTIERIKEIMNVSVDAQEKTKDTMVKTVEALQVTEYTLGKALDTIEATAAAQVMAYKHMQRTTTVLWICVMVQFLVFVHMLLSVVLQ